MALLDSYSRLHNYLRLSLTGKCNFKCSYCYTPNTPAPQISTDFMLRLVRLFASQGVEKVRLTGGEPLVHPDVVEIASKVKKIQGINHLAITTNGFLLYRHLPGLLEAGLDSMNLSLDSLVPAKFAFIAKFDGFDKVWKGFEEAYGKIKIKLNCVVMRGINDDEILDFIKLAENRNISVRFIEFVPYTGNQWDDKRFFSHTEIMEIVEKRYKVHRINLEDPIAKYYQIEGFAGTMGVIGSITEPFCDRCNRLRITADGKFKVCLNSPQEIELNDTMNDDELLLSIRQELMKKPKEHGGIEKMIGNGNRPMIGIGG
jgi:molybdenum cofactor biosynthesis protein A